MSVTIEDFERYRKLKERTRCLEHELKTLRKKNNNRVKDKVTGSMKKYPYIKQNIPIEGLKNNSRRIKKLEGELARKRAEMLALGARIDGFLKTVEDGEIKDVLILHYIDGITYRKIPQYFGRVGDGSTERKRIKAYFKRL